MSKRMVRFLSLFISVTGTLVFLGQEALAGPPLLCHPFEIGDARSLPWGGGPGWQTIDSRYDINRLADDTVSLLGDETPVIVRMETLRRATVYVMDNHNLAAALHARLAARAGKTKGRSAALALFDLGYLEETYKQTRYAAKLKEAIRSLDSLDGYSSVVRAIKMCGGDAGMEFAAAIISTSPKRSALDEHLRKAVAGAAPGSLLALNITRHFRDRGITIAGLRDSKK